MKVLWITNILFPEALAQLRHDGGELRGSGGWLVSSANELLINDSIKLVVASVSSLVKKVTFIQGKNIRFYALPCRNERKYHKSFEMIWKDICAHEQPDLVHIHGTEFSHGLAFLKANTGIKSIVSIQGVVSAIGQYYLSGLKRCDVIKNTTLFDLLYAGTLFKQKRKYIRQGEKVEKPMLLKADYVIGRTSFDEAWVRWMNPEVQYFTCNESLREEFYNGSWDYAQCAKHSIFLSQGNYPVKGLHIVIEALPYLIKRYPDLQIRIAGKSFTQKTNVKSRLMSSTYSEIIRRKIKKYKLFEHISFLGALNAEEMKNEYLRTNIFLCPSTIENSPNSLGEAQILGVPCVAAYVGGVPDFMYQNYNSVLYRFDDIPSLVKSICDQFEKTNNFKTELSSQVAKIRHNLQINNARLLNIYEHLIHDKK